MLNLKSAIFIKLIIIIISALADQWCHKELHKKNKGSCNNWFGPQRALNSSWITSKYWDSLNPQSYDKFSKVFGTTFLSRYLIDCVQRNTVANFCELFSVSSTIAFSLSLTGQTVCKIIFVNLTITKENNLQVTQSDCNVEIIIALFMQPANSPKMSERTFPFFLQQGWTQPLFVLE